MRTRDWSIPILIGALFGGLPLDAYGRVKLITLPLRQRVEIQLDHPSATLVEEERVVPLVKGENQIDFSWSNTQIDRGTIVFRVVGSAQPKKLKVNVLSVSYPPGENALVWQVWASDSGSARVRISYLLGRLDKSFNYRAVAENDERTVTVSQYIRVRNFAGEQFEDTNIHVGFGDKFTKPIGLNETKEMLVERFQGVPITKTYSCNPHEFGYLDRAQDKLRVPMHYVLTNDEDHKLGKAPLPYGKVRIFQKDSADSTVFIGEDWGAFTPIDDQMKLYVGLAQDVLVKRTIDRVEPRRRGGNRRYYEVTIKYEIENFKDQPVKLDVIEEVAKIRQEAGFGQGRPPEWEIGDQTTFQGGADAEDTTHEKVVFHANLPARKGDKAKKIVHNLELVYLNEW